MEFSEAQQNLLDRVAAENGLESDFQLLTASGSGKGDNFLGTLTAITLKNKEKSLELILKSAPKSEQFFIHGIYDREIYLYKRVFEEFKKFQEDNNIDDPFTSTPKFYGSCVDNEEEWLVMENLKTIGYQLWDKKVPMNHQHIKAVLIEYAKFHAVSFAMREKNPKLFEDLSKSIRKNVFVSEGTTSKEYIGTFLTDLMKSGYKAVEGDTVLTDCMKRVEQKLYDLYLHQFQKEELKLVINHGDCWCNNFLFQYQDSKNTTTPTSLRIIDWQVSSVTSPTNDICYFLLTNSSQKIFDDFEIYVQLYYDALRSQLGKYNCDVEKLFPYSTYREHLGLFMPLAIQQCIMIMKIAVCDPEEAPNFEVGSLDFDYDIRNMEGYKNRMSMIVRFVDKNKFV